MMVLCDSHIRPKLGGFPQGSSPFLPSPPPSQPPLQPSVEYSCEEIGNVPASEQCSFMRGNCLSDSRIPYAEWYYCSVSSHGAAAQMSYVMLLLLLLPLFFTMLGDTAEMYFSPIMSHISQSIPKMRPRFAGVTFVAIGNGAPDLSANISAIRNGQVLLSAGALTGAAMFVQCVVGSEVLRISEGGVKCRGATLRDVAIYIASVIMVLSAFAHGTITRWFIAGAIVLYLVYAVWVFCGDEWHERGRPGACRSEFCGRSGRAPWASDALGPLPPHQLQPQQLPETGALLGSGLSSSTPLTTHGSNINPTPFGSYTPPQGNSPRQDQEPGARDPGNGSSHRHSSGGGGWGPGGGGGELGGRMRSSSVMTELGSAGVGGNGSRVGRRATGQEDGNDAASIASSRVEPRHGWWGRLRHQLTIGSSSEWEEFDGFRRRFRRLTYPILLPVYVALRCSVPFVDPDSYSRRWLVITMLAVVTYFEVGPEAISSGWLRQWSVMWIDTLATEVVGMVSLIASLLHLPSSLVGLSLLAVGNSLGDFFSNTAMARRGQFSTALTACVASPLFNMLISLAAGFASYFAAHHVTSTDVVLRPEVTLGCCMLMAYNVIMVLVGYANRGTLPRRFYLFARAWYALYIGLAFILGFT
ncbi:MAG: hypothetical protein WDW38_004802 [Sanguina aurantia]